MEWWEWRLLSDIRSEKWCTKQPVSCGPNNCLFYRGYGSFFYTGQKNGGKGRDHIHPQIVIFLRIYIWYAVMSLIPRLLNLFIVVLVSQTYIDEFMSCIYFILSFTIALYTGCLVVGNSWKGFTPSSTTQDLVRRISQCSDCWK